MKPGVSAVQATTDLRSVATYLTRTYPKDDDGLTFSLARPGLLGNLLGGPVRAFITVAEAVKYKVSPGYFQAADTTLVAGRTFTGAMTKTHPR